MVQMVKKLPAVQEPGAIPRSGRSPEEGKSLPTPVSLPGESHGQRNLAGYYSPWGCKELDMTEQLTFSILMITYPVIELNYLHLQEEKCKK